MKTIDVSLLRKKICKMDETMKEMEFFNNHPKLKQELLESLNVSDSDFVNEDELEW